jgi:hypothetical protein
MKSGKRAEPLSPQQLISCDQFANGCEGGDTAEAMGWLERVDLAMPVWTHSHYVTQFHCYRTE